MRSTAQQRFPRIERMPIKTAQGHGPPWTAREDATEHHPANGIGAQYTLLQNAGTSTGIDTGYGLHR